MSTMRKATEHWGDDPSRGSEVFLKRWHLLRDLTVEKTYAG